MNALVPLGDQGALAYFAAEAEALRFAEAVRRANDPWLSMSFACPSVAVYFDLHAPTSSRVLASSRSSEIGANRRRRRPCT